MSNYHTPRARWSVLAGMRRQRIAPGQAAGYRPKRSGSTRLVAVAVGNTLGEMKMLATAAPITPVDLGIRRPWGFTHSERHRKVSMTWLETSTHGWRIGSMRITIESRPLRIQRVLLRETGAFCAAGLGTAVRGSCVRRTASRSNPCTGSSTVGSVVPGKFLPLDSLTLFPLLGQSPS